MIVTIRKFREEDILNKVRWINDPENNRYLHYELPLREDKTREWFYNNQTQISRFDAVIEVNGIPIGLIGLISILNGKAEYYITIGEKEYKGKGIAKNASNLLFSYAKDILNLKILYLYTEIENISAQKLFEKLGFVKIRLDKNSALNRGVLVDRFYYEYKL